MSVKFLRYIDLLHRFWKFLSAENGYIQEQGWDVAPDKNDYRYRIQGKRTVETLDEIDKLSGREGIYYMNEQYRLKTGKDYNLGKGLAKNMKDVAKDAINPLKDAESRRMFLLDLMVDLYRGIGNKLLEGNLGDYMDTLGAEARARAGITVETK